MMAQTCCAIDAPLKVSQWRTRWPVQTTVTGAGSQTSNLTEMQVSESTGNRNRGCRQKLEPKIFSRYISTARCGAFVSSVTPVAEMKWLFFQPEAACISVAALQRNTVTERQRNTIVAAVTALVQPFQYMARRSARLYRRNGANVCEEHCDATAEESISGVF
jgi:hypothetical protein